FNEVSFSYENGGVKALNRFSLHIRPGETVALVGHTGSGKSSATRLLLRYYDHYEGSIKLDGRDISTLSKEALRRSIGYVPQTPFLFSGTVRDNIRYGCPETDRDEIERMAQSICGGAWLKSFR